MSRKRKAPIREVLSDPIFNSKIVTKLINTIMLDGKKSTAERILYSAFEIVKEKTNEDPLVIFQKAVENVTPLLEVRTRRIGGTNYPYHLKWANALLASAILCVSSFFLTAPPVPFEASIISLANLISIVFSVLILA